MGLSFRTIQPHIRAEAPLPLLCALRRPRHGLWLSVTFHWCCPLDIPGARQLIEAGHGTQITGRVLAGT